MSAKTVHFIRHAQSAHNARVQEVPDEDMARNDPALRDAPLSSLGQNQAAALQSEIAGLREIELVVTSPLTRAIQTTLAAFDGHPAPRLVEALHREHQDSFCDIGRPPAALALDFTSLRFDHLENPWWQEDPEHGGPFLRESLSSLERRVAAFADWLSARPEQTVAVVGHGTFLRTLTGHPFDNAQRVMMRF